MVRFAFRGSDSLLSAPGLQIPTSTLCSWIEALTSRPDARDIDVALTIIERFGFVPF